LALSAVVVNTTPLRKGPAVTMLIWAAPFLRKVVRTALWLLLTNCSTLAGSNEDLL